MRPASSRPTWHQTIGGRAAGHPRVAPALVGEIPEKVNISRLVSAAADAAFDAGYGYGAGGDASHGMTSLCDLLNLLGCDWQEALKGLEREYAAGLKQGKAVRLLRAGGRL